MVSREEELVKQFKDLQADLKDWGTRVDKEIMKLITDSPFDNYFVKLPPSHRIKEKKSFIEKALYRKKPYKDPMVEIEDKIGTRVVLLKSDDIEFISQLLLKNEIWEAKETKSRIGEIESKPHIFDYQSQHLVVFPKPDDKYGNKNVWMGCEIQIRTLLQHAFAEVSHDSTYKGPYKNDKEIIRQLSKSMALMEATDDYFCNIFNMMSDQTRKYSNYVNELIRIYETLGKKFEKDTLSFEITEDLLSLLDKKEVSIPDVEQFVVKNFDSIKEALESSNDFILTQPIVLLIDYYIENHPSFLKDNWPINDDAYVTVLNAFNHSAGEY